MTKTLHRADTRGSADYGWLQTAYSFSFADWYDPSRMGFGVLRVINDDRIAGGEGFPPHNHRDMEIITIVRTGAVAHKDSMGNAGVVPAGDVQVMSAGTGVQHSEYNNSLTEELTLFQIWVESKTRGIEPRYAQKSFGLEQKKSGETLVVSPDAREGSLSINQDAYITHLALLNGDTTYTMKQAGNGVYLFVIEGNVLAEGETLNSRDALGLTDVGMVQIKTLGPASALLIEVPIK